ncbi:MAG: 30S ribosomal protein S1 [Micavibrio sp.]|nr:MAG: 30S ribosomal protein S1 [Micavibrio sp.]
MANALKYKNDWTPVKEITGESESFEKMLAETLGEVDSFEGMVVNGVVVSVDDDAVTVDVGLKSEGRIPLKEFGVAGSRAEIKAGDMIEVYVDRMESRNGETVLSREKARREEAWGELEKLYEAGEQVTGTIFGRVKGGFTVDLNGAVAFLPGSQVDIRPIRDTSALFDEPQPFQILKMDRARGNIVVSRRAVLEESREEARSELIANLEEGQVLKGIVKNITDYGAFIDLGGVDGLLHVTDMSWKRINHPTEMLSVGQTIDVQIIKFNEETQRVSLGLKQLQSDPWDDVAGRYKIGDKYKGLITNITDYGAFVELEDGVEGLVHVSEMSWTKKNVHPGKIVSTSQEVEIMVLDIDEDKRRISLGLKQCADNPWLSFADNHKAGDILEGEIRNITEFGLFVGVDEDIDGMVHLSDLSWEKQGDEALKDYTKGQMVKVKILEVQADKERVSLGIKQLEADPFTDALGDLKKGDVVTCTISEISNDGINVTVNEGQISGFIRKADLSRERSEQRPDRFAVGEKLDAKITKVERGSRQLQLSVKAYEIDEDKHAMAEYGSSDSGASLGDILGVALQQQGSDEKEKKAKTAAKAPAKKTAKKADKDAEADAEKDTEKDAEKAEKKPAKKAAAKKPAAKKTAKKDEDKDKEKDAK